MSAPSAGSLADRVARQLGLDSAGVDGTGPNGSATLTDVLRQAGRRPPAAARLSPPRTVLRAGEETGPETRRMEVACDEKPIRDTCTALAACAAEPPETLDLVVRLCGTALRDHPGLSGAADGNEEGRHPGSIEILVTGLALAVPIHGVDRAGVGSIRVAMRTGRPASRAGPHGSSGGRAEPAEAFVIRTPDAPDVRPGALAGGRDRRGGAVLTINERPGSILLGLEFGAGSEEDAEAFLDRLRSLCLDPRRALL